MAIDPVCRMEVDEATALQEVRDGQTYYFCCEHCRQKFLKGSAGEPQLVALGALPAAGASHSKSASGRYICPMCPGVESDHPAACPRCGMALEPAVPTAARE